MRKTVKLDFGGYKVTFRGPLKARMKLGNDTQAFPEAVAEKMQWLRQIGMNDEANMLGHNFRFIYHLSQAAKHLPSEKVAPWIEYSLTCAGIISDGDSTLSSLSGPLCRLGEARSLTGVNYGPRSR